MVKKFKFDLAQIDRVVNENLVSLLKKYSIFTFTGPLGVGKTTIIRATLRQCGVRAVVSSPTFGYVNSYVVGDMTYNHFDLYRIATVDEFISQGFDEYFARENNINFIEWPELIEKLIKSPELCDKVCEIKISYILDDVNSREVEIIAKK